MKNTLTDVRNHLIEAMERLNDDELCKDKEAVQKEIQKAQALSDLAEQIASISQVEINAKNAEIEAVKAAWNMGMTYKPEGFKLEDRCSAHAINNNRIN